MNSKAERIDRIDTDEHGQISLIGESGATIDSYADMLDCVRVHRAVLEGVLEIAKDATYFVTDKRVKTAKTFLGL